MALLGRRRTQAKEDVLSPSLKICVKPHLRLSVRKFSSLGLGTVKTYFSALMLTRC